MQKPKVAFVHDYLVQYGGAEKTLEALLEVYPDSPIYTGIYNTKRLSKFLNEQHIIGPQKGFFSKIQKYMTFLMPYVFENFDLSQYDIVISDGVSWAKGVLTTPDQLHISYIHTPPRFLYGYSVESKQKRDLWYLKPFVRIIDFYLRIWDYYASQRPDFLLTNSYETQRRISKFYRRNAIVIYPPVDVFFEPSTTNRSSGRKIKKPYYVILGRLSAYKNFDLVIRAFNKMEKDLVVIGTGVEEGKLREMAGSTIHFEGSVSEERKHYLLENCLGVINPVEEEDLGIVPIEAMAHGKPVLAHKSGGHLETIQEDISGVFFEKLELEPFIKKFNEFEAKIASEKFNPDVIKDSVEKFEKERFQKEIKDYIDKTWNEFKKNV